MSNVLQNYGIVVSRSEIGAGKRGAASGPEKLINLFSEQNIVEALHFNENKEPTSYKYAKYNNLLQQVFEDLASKVKKTLKDKNRVIVFTGDHSNAIGSVAGTRLAFPDKKIGLIWIDAHADLHSPYTTPSGNMHGMSLGALMGIDNFEGQINNPHNNTISNWERIKRIGGLKPGIVETDKVVLISLRDTEQQEKLILKKYNIKYFGPETIRKVGIETVLKESLEHLKTCDCLHVSFDADSLDKNISDATGTPVENGLSLSEARYLLKELWNNSRTCTLEITEINDKLGDSKMGEIVSDILQYALQSGQEV